MAENIEFEKAIRNAMLSDLGLSRNDELPMENFHDRKVTYDPGRRQSRAVAKTATSAWKAVGEKGIDDEEARSVQGLADLGGGRAHAIQHNAESQGRNERLQQIHNRPRPQQFYQSGALANISNFGGLERPGVPVTVFAPKSTMPDGSSAVNIPPHKRAEEHITAKELSKTQASDVVQKTSNTASTASAASIITPHLRSKAQAAALYKKDSQQAQAGPPITITVSGQGKQAQLTLHPQDITEKKATESIVEVQGKHAEDLDRPSGKVLWTWSTDCEAQITSDRGMKRFDARVVLKMIELGNSRQQAGFVLRYTKDASDKDSGDDILVVKDSRTQTETNRPVNLVYDMTSYKASSGRHEDNWCDVSFESGTKKKDITLFFVDAEVMKSFRGAAIALQTSLSISRLTTAQKFDLRARLNAHKVLTSELQPVAGNEGDEQTPEASSVRADETETKNLDADGGGIGIQQQSPEISTKAIHDKTEETVINGTPKVNTASRQPSPGQTVVKYTPEALKSMNNASSHLTPPAKKWQYTETVLKNGRVIKTPKSLATAKHASQNSTPSSGKVAAASSSDHAPRNKDDAQSEIVVDFTAPSVSKPKIDFSSTKPKAETTRPEKLEAAFNFASPPGAPSMPTVAALGVEPELGFNFNTLPGVLEDLISDGAQDESQNGVKFTSPPGHPAVSECVAEEVLQNLTTAQSKKVSGCSQVMGTEEDHAFSQHNSALANVNNAPDQNTSNAELGQIWSMISMMNSISEVNVIEETTTIKTTRRYVLPVGAAIPSLGSGHAAVPQNTSTSVVADVDSTSNVTTRLSGDAPVFQPTHGSVPQPSQGSQVGVLGQQQRKGLAGSKYAQPTQTFNHAGRFTGSLRE
ncbi:hypothetical protein ACHAQH_003130 [Verticillium albo-atrum]